MNLVQIHSRTVACLAVTILLAGGAVARGQRPQGGGTLIVDFVAVTADGKPVADLKPEDVAIKVAGKARTISTLTAKKSDAPAAAPAAPAAAAAPDAGALTPPFFSNDPATTASSSMSGGGRFFLIVVDTESLQAGTEAALKLALNNLLNGLTPADHVAFSIAPRDTAQVGFNMGLQKVRDAVAALRGSRPASVNAADSLCRTSDTLNLMKALLDPLQANDVPTSVIFAAGSLSTSGSEKSTSGGTCVVTQDQFQTLSGVAAMAHANFYVVQGDSATMGRNDGLEALAGVTGAGTVLRVVNEGFAPRVLADSSNYWMATLAPDPSDRPGQSQRLEVKAVREGITIRSRAEAAVARNAAPAAAAPKAGGTTSLKDMVKTTAPFTDLQLHASAYYARGAADKMTVLVMAEPADPTVKLKEMSFAYFDQEGKGASATPTQMVTFPISTGFSLPSGSYRIRVAAIDSTGKSGAVDVTVNTALIPAGPLRLGGLLIGAATPNGLKPMITFTTEEKGSAYLELYGQISAAIDIRFEIAKSDTGPAVETIKPNGGATNEPDKFQVNAELPLAKLAPGDYVLRVLVKMEGQPEGRVLRGFRKTGK